MECLSLSSASVAIVALGYTPNPRAARFNRPKVQCEACGYGNRAQDRMWLQLCEECAIKIRRADFLSVSRTGIRLDMLEIGIPVRFGTRDDGTDPVIYEGDGHFPSLRGKRKRKYS